MLPQPMPSSTSVISSPPKVYQWHLTRSFHISAHGSLCLALTQHPKQLHCLCPPSSQENHLGMVSLAMKEAEGKGLEISDTKHLSKVKLSDETTINVLCHMLSNMAAYVVEIMGNLSILTKQLYTW
eukprot:2371576-Ditylum_brightwellii.AAC.1